MNLRIGCETSSIGTIDCVPRKPHDRPLNLHIPVQRPIALVSHPDCQASPRSWVQKPGTGQSRAAGDRFETANRSSRKLRRCPTKHTGLNLQAAPTSIIGIEVNLGDELYTTVLNVLRRPNAEFWTCKAI